MNAVDKPTALTIIDAALSEAGYPGAVAINGAGDILDQSVPPEVMHRAWSLAMDAQGITPAPFEEWCRHGVDRQAAWERYLSRHGLWP